MTRSRSICFLVIGLLSPLPAFAHHAMGGTRPVTFVQGFLSGLAHPVIGLDHFAFLAIAGVLASPLGPPMRYGAPVVLATSALVGTTLHLAGVSLTMAEALIALSVILGGGLALLRHRMNGKALFAFFAVAGVFHGYAYAESIVGAQSAPLLAYLAGLAVIQVALTAGIIFGLEKLRTWTNHVDTTRLERVAGGLAFLSGVVFLASSLA